MIKFLKKIFFLGGGVEQPIIYIFNKGSKSWTAKKKKKKRKNKEGTKACFLFSNAGLCV